MSLFDLSGKTALITGASSGLGARAAQTLAAAGARVILTARRFDKLQALAAQLQNALPVRMDVTDKQMVQAVFQQLNQSGEKIDITLCAAGIGGGTPIFDSEASSEHFERVIQTNLMGIWYVTQAAANHMKQHQIAGSIVLIASITGVNRVRARITGYAASKAGVIQLTKSLVGELSKENIRINCIAPGLFHTPMTDYKLNTPAMRKEMAGSIPLGFVANPEQLDGMVLYLASNKASAYTTGSCMAVDGGEAWGGQGSIDKVPIFPRVHK
jgi:NAD(P)-dependent dehydrogenase (short-subunit alcohol dehydrogenase family)